MISFTSKLIPNGMISGPSTSMAGIADGFLLILYLEFIHFLITIIINWYIGLSIIYGIVSSGIIISTDTIYIIYFCDGPIFYKR